MPDAYGSKPYTPKKVDHSSGHAFLSSAGDIFYSPNCTRRVEVPVHDPDTDYPFRVQEAKFDTFLSPRWWKKPYHYLSFINLRPSFEGIVFSCLRDIVPYIEHLEDNRYALATRKVNRWLLVENSLIMMSHFLSQSYRLQVRAALNPIPPSLLGFNKTFYTARSARLRISASRDWFLVWMALISSKIADIETKVEEDKRGDWFAVLTEQDVPQDWLSAVQSSIICDFSRQCPRVGTFLNIFSPEPDQPSVEWFYSWNIPIWYCWGRGHPRLAHLQPPPHVLQAATTFISKTPTFLPPTSLPSSSLPVISSLASPPHNRHEYSPGEYKRAQEAYLATKPWVAYFDDWEKRNQRSLVNESPEDRTTRLNRERKPPTVSATVFLWEWSDGPTIELLRRRVSKNEREDVLGNHSDAQCVYDSVNNSWEVCEYFGDDDDDDEEEEEEDEDMGFYDDNDCDYLDAEPNADPQAVHEKLIDERVRQNVTCPQQAMEVVRSHNLGPEVDLTHTGMELNLLRYLSHYYGFVPPLPVPDIDTTLVDHNDWNDCLKSVGLRTGEHNPPLPGLTGPIVAFIRGLQRHGPKEFEWDLQPGNRQHLAPNNVQCFRKLNKCLYLLDSTVMGVEKSTGWQIAVTTSVNALYILRYIRQTLDVPSVEALAQHLAEEGIPFRTFLSLDPSPSSISLEAIETKIPRRTANYSFKPADYESYVARRRQLLATPRGRAAILQGGIVGRLAKEHLGVETAASGPSSAVTVHHLGYSIEISGTTYWDDGLTTDEIAVICGLHLCYTGNGDQTAMMSWWPLPHYWDNKNNSYNWGHWTEWDEVWYQQRLSAIQGGSAEDSLPLAQNDWRSYLRSTSVWRKVTQCILAKSDMSF